MFKILLAVIALGTFASINEASAYVPFAQRCAWAPNDPDVCAAKRACTPNPANRRCAKYCNVNPRDVVCGEVYQKPLSRQYPGYDTPYPWGRSGPYCYQNPWAAVCRYENWYR